MRPGPAEMAAAVTALFNSAQDDPELSERMGFAETVVQMNFVDDHDEACATVWLDRNPIEAQEGSHGDAEIEITGPPKVWIGMITGKVDMAMAIVRRDLTYSGPVRKFLRVVPILQSFDFGAFRGAQNGEMASADDAPAAPPPPPPGDNVTRLSPPAAG